MNAGRGPMRETTRNESHRNFHLSLCAEDRRSADVETIYSTLDKITITRSVDER